MQPVSHWADSSNGREGFVGDQGAVPVVAMLPLALCLLAGAANAQEASTPRIARAPPEPSTRACIPFGLDEQRVYRIRGASLDRPNLHLVFDDGTLAFTEDICGRVTGALFEGEGEVLLRPPNRVERESIALFTGMAILEEQFTSGYLRFNDDTASALQSPVSRWRRTVPNS